MQHFWDSPKKAGKFDVAPDKSVYGELTLDGPNTSLYLHDRENFSTHDLPDHCLRGVLLDLTKVSLLECITKSGPGSGRRGGESYCFANLFPHFVIHGDHYITPAEKTITEIRFEIDDATTLFYDFDAFGSVRDAKPFIEQIAHANGLDREILTGPEPRILYFTGRREIFAAETALGRISATHNPSYPMGGPNGVGIKNRIVVSIAFGEPVSFDGAIAATMTLHRYLGVLVGRPQNLLTLGLQIKPREGEPYSLRVYWCMPPRRDPSHDEQRTHPAEVLLDAVRQPEAFSRVLAAWLDREPAWQDARGRFYRCFAGQNYYDTNRLIAAANMFDILPDTAVPAEVTLSPELADAKNACRKIFKQLPDSPERQSVLGELGRVGKSYLKQKINYRAQPLIEALRGKFPDLALVTNEAVNCRNHYVHGSDPRFNYNENSNALSFFTNTLEFVFGVSDLMEAGWDVVAWNKIPTSMAHPFGAYRVNYTLALKELKKLLPVPSAP
jgi:hypothetical protein